MKVHEVIKPKAITLSTNFGKHNFVKQPVLASDKDGNVPARVPNQIANSQPSFGNVPMPYELWFDSLGSEKIGSCSSLHNMEFPNVDDFLWDYNLCDFNSLWDI
ncbi:hypothetical protein TSUD_247130 [Trifolium subterraneum]|uniref:Uncharacterized protein n=1 Tax=Trifolium subterraneum TaxID=3900 RepID=A0A2Z6MVH4_TRISU|nr:hypothetical protein TSUD_247130 [Trifolium subterraneum]